MNAAVAPLRRALRLLLAAFAALTATAPASAADRVALVIGNSAYGGDDTLYNPVIDASAIRKALVASGIKPIARYNVNIQAFNKALDAFGAQISRLPAGSTALFYYSGHGFTYNGINYLAPIDSFQGKGQFAAEDYVALSTVVAKLALKPTVDVVVVIDACRDIAKYRSAGIAVEGLHVQTLPANFTLVYSAQEGFSAADGVYGQGSPFTRAMLEELTDPGSVSNGHFGNIAASVAEQTLTQHPSYQGKLSSFETLFTIIPNFSRCLICEINRIGREKGQKAAFDYVKGLAEKSDPEAMYFLGYYYMNEPPVFDKKAMAAVLGKEQDVGTALHWYEKSARAGYMDGFLHWGKLNLQDYPGHPKNYSAAFEAYTVGAEMGSASSVYMLARMQSDETYGMVNYPKAVAIYEENLKANGCCAAINLGDIYFHGYGGIPKNRLRAIELFKLAASRGNAKGYTFLAYVARIDGDFKTASKYFNAAIQAGDLHAVSLYGKMLWNNFTNSVVGFDESSAELAYTLFQQGLQIANKNNDAAEARKFENDLSILRTSDWWTRYSASSH